jgi:hypothetical protein
VRGKGIKCRLCFIGLQVVYPAGVARHQSVSSVIDSENVPASFEIAETRWPGEQRGTCTQFGGSSVPCVELTALSLGLTIAILQPPVDEVEPG